MSGLQFEDSYSATIMKAKRFIKVVLHDDDQLVLVPGGTVIPSSDDWTLGCYRTESGSWNQKHKFPLGVSCAFIQKSDNRSCVYIV